MTCEIINDYSLKKLTKNEKGVYPNEFYYIVLKNGTTVIQDTHSKKTYTRDQVFNCSLTSKYSTGKNGMYEFIIGQVPRTSLNGTVLTPYYITMPMNEIMKYYDVYTETNLYNVGKSISRAVVGTKTLGGKKNTGKKTRKQRKSKRKSRRKL